MGLLPGLVTFPSAETTVPVSPERSLNPAHSDERHLLNLAQAAAWLLQHPNISLRDFQLQTRCRVQLVNLGMASFNKRFRQLEILKAFQEKFTPELLAFLSCDWSIQYENASWLSRLLQGGHNCPNFVLYSLLLILFVADDIPTFLTLPTNFTPFGNGPWPCLNPACPHDGERCMTSCDVYYHHDGRPRGTFTCPTCGLSYRRTGPDTSPNDLYRTQHILRHGPLWDAKLREVWFDPALNTHRMSSALRSTWQYMRRRGTELGLPFPPPGVRPTPLTSNPLPLQNPTQGVNPTAYRRRLLEIIQQHPDWGVKDICKQFNPIYSWLRANDCEWLKHHKPTRRYKKRQDVRVNWKQRDEDLAAEVGKGHERLMVRQNNLFQVTATAILNEIQRRGYYTRNRYRLPRTVAHLEQLAETTQEYAIRRVWHYASLFREAGAVPRRRVLAERASVHSPPNRHNPVVQIAVDEAMVWLCEG